jgi:hypothetical protein
MSRKTRQPVEEELDNLWWAMTDYRARFGQDDITTIFLTKPQQRVAARLMREAIKRGRRTSNAEFHERAGIEPPPPGAVI